MGNSPVVNRINALLAEKGIQKRAFYKDCGITSASYSLWNTGKTTPRMKNLEVIADYLNTTTDYLLTGLGEKEKMPTSDGELEMSKPMILLNRAAKNMTLEQQEKLLDLSRIMFKEAFDD